MFRDVAQFGSARGSGPRGREFESHHSDQKGAYGQYNYFSL